MEDKKTPSREAGDAPGQIALTIVEAAKVSGTSRSTIYEALQHGELVGRKLGRRTLILLMDLEHFLTTLPTYADQMNGRGSANG